MDTEENLPFLKTYHNMCRKNGKISYRSPFSNHYFPPIEDGVFPSPLVRNIEEKGRLLFDEYTKLYYGENCVSNFFVEEGEEEFCFAFYAQKSNKDMNQGIIIKNGKESGTRPMWQISPETPPSPLPTESLPQLCMTSHASTARTSHTLLRGM